MRAVVVRSPPPGPGIAAHAKATAASDGTRRHIPPGGGGRASNLLLTHYYTLIWAQPQPPPAIASLFPVPCLYFNVLSPLPLPSNLPQRKNRSIFPPEETHAYQTEVTTQQRGLLKRKRRRGAKLVFPSLDRQSAGFRPLCLCLSLSTGSIPEVCSDQTQAHKNIPQLFFLVPGKSLAIKLKGHFPPGGRGT